jgi:hypothetical protein
MKLVDKSTKPTKKPIDRVENLEKTVEQLSMSVRVSQMLLKQVLEQLQKHSDGLRSTTGMINDFQYRVLAMQNTLNLDKVKLAAAADELKLADWQSASDRDDIAAGLQSLQKVESATDYVVLTSTTPGVAEDRGIFRSKIQLAESGNKDLIDALVGKSVGEQVTVKLNGDDHLITLLGVRRQVQEQPAK